MTSSTRRDVLKLGIAGAGSLIMPKVSWARPNTTEPHFFIQIVMDTGADSSYMFDARPLEMKKAGKIQNYLPEDQIRQASQWIGSNGTSCLTSVLAKPLEKFKNDFSVINGVFMSADFDGHTQNLNYMITGNPFGGDSFVPHLNMPETGRTPTSLDCVMSGYLNLALENSGGIVPLKPDSTALLAKKLAGLKPAAPGDELIDFVRARLRSSAGGDGRFSAASRLMLTGLDRSPELHERFTQVKEPVAGQDPQQQFCALIADCFRLSIARSATWVIKEDFDTHASSQAKNQPTIFTNTIAKLATIFQSLKDLPFDDKRSILDVTTVMITSEFGRTMKSSPQANVDDTGTDHNALSNSILIGGKGIRGGLVVGASDYQSSEEKLSGAHQKLDKNLIKAMGRPFDFATLKPAADLPESFEQSNYLNVGSVINTLYKLFGVSSSRFRSIGRQNPQVLPVLAGLMK